MKKITKNQLGNKIAKYGALSVAIAGVADATGQVNFTDVDPDFNAVAVGDEFLVDMNGDGTSEFNIVVGDFNGNNFTALVDTDDLLGLIVGQQVGNYTYALNLAEGDMIDASTGTFGTVGSLCYLDGIDGTFCGAGNSTPDGFAGVSFNLNGATHFGWIGLENVTSSSFTVTAFAFEETPDTAIAAGAGILSVESQVFADFEHFTSNGLLTLKAASPLENVVIYNINGQEVLNRALSASTESVDLSAQATGVYIAKVTIDGAEKSFKIIK